MQERRQKMAVPLDKRTHWFVGTNKWGQEMRMCNGYVSGFFVGRNDTEHLKDVDCTACKKHLASPDKLAKKVFEYNKYRALWG